MITPEIVSFIFSKMNFDDNEEMAEEFVSYLQFYYSMTMEIKPTMARLREVHRAIDYVRGVDYGTLGGDETVIVTGRQGGKITKVETLTKRPQDPDPILTVHEMEQQQELTGKFGEVRAQMDRQKRIDNEQEAAEEERTGMSKQDRMIERHRELREYVKKESQKQDIRIQNTDGEDEKK